MRVTKAQRAVISQLRELAGRNIQWSLVSAEWKRFWLAMARWHLKKLREARKERK